MFCSGLLCHPDSTVPEHEREQMFPSFLLGFLPVCRWLFPHVLIDVPVPILPLVTNELFPLMFEDSCRRVGELRLGLVRSPADSFFAGRRQAVAVAFDDYQLGALERIEG